MMPVVFPVRSKSPLGAVSYVDSYGAPRSQGRAHEGVDIFADEGSPVLAVEAGRVAAVDGERTGVGVRLDTSEGRYQYAHLAERAGSFPRFVSAGELIGWVGATGNAAGGPPHLHFEVRGFAGEPVNPVPLLSGLRLPLAPLPPAPMVRVSPPRRATSPMPAPAPAPLGSALAWLALAYALSQVAE